MQKTWQGGQRATREQSVCLDQIRLGVMVECTRELLMQQRSEGSGGWMELWRWMLVGRWCATKMSKNGEYLRSGWADFPETWTVGKKGKRAFWWCVKMRRLIRRNLRYGGNEVGRAEGHQQVHKTHCKRAQRVRLITCRVLCPLDKCKRQRDT